MQASTSLKQLIQSSLPPSQVDHLRWIVRNTKGTLYSDDLCKLAVIFGCDKWNWHYYAQHYQRFFNEFRDKPITLLEIGVGGYENNAAGGASLRMWAKYFPKARIYAFDLHDKSAIKIDRVKILRGDQTDVGFLKDLVAETGPLDIVIDDGSHFNDHIVKTFEALFPSVKQGGLYCVEDLQTSYWAGFGGAQGRSLTQPSAMNYFLEKAHGLNYEEFEDPNYAPTALDQSIFGMHFFHSLMILEKGDNREGSTRTMG